MTQNIRTLDQIFAELADNTSGQISPQDVRDAIITAYAASVPLWTDVAFVTGQQVRRDDGKIYQALTDIPAASGFNLDASPAQWLLTVDGDLEHGAQISALETAVDAINGELVTQTTGGVEFVEGNTVIDASDIAMFRNKNVVYNNPNNASVLITLPTDAVITTNGDFPFEIEFSHLGGEGRALNNVVIITVPPGEDAIALPSAGNVQFVTLRKGDLLYLRKADAASTWEAAVQTSNSAAIATGIFNLRVDFIIGDPSSIPTQLAMATINAGDAFLVTGQGDFFGTTLRQNDIIVAEQDNPSIQSDSNDWTVVRNTRNAAGLTTAQLLLLASFIQTGLRFDANDRVFINAVNVDIETNTATGTPVVEEINLIPNGDGSTQIVTDFTPNITLAEIVGGRLELDLSISAKSTSGFIPEGVKLELQWDSLPVNWSFDISSVDFTSSVQTLSIDIPELDYTSILNVAPNRARLTVNFRGASYLGDVTITALRNINKGPLRDSIVAIAQTEAKNVEDKLQSEIDNIVQNSASTDSVIADIENRISPIRRVEQFVADSGDARFLNSSGVDAFPSDLSTMARVDPDHQTFTVSGTAVFIAVRGDLNHFVENVTTSTRFELSSSAANSNPSLSLGASVTFNNLSYFIYRLTQLSANDIVKVLEASEGTEVAWAADIDRLQSAVSEIENYIEAHPTLNLPPATVSWLKNDLSIVQESVTTLIPSQFNLGLNAGSQAIFDEAGSTPTETPTSKQSAPLSASTSGTLRRGRKLIYLPMVDVANGSTILRALDAPNGSPTNDIIRRQDGNLVARKHLNAVPATSRTVTRFPAPSNQVAKDWFNIETLTFRNGVPVTEADELFFTRDLPTSPTTLTLHYRGIANGNPFGEAQTTLNNVGGSSNVSTSVTINDGSEEATITFAWIASSRSLRVSVTERVFTGLPTINSVQVRPEWTETITTPAQAARDVDVILQSYVVNSVAVLMLSPSETVRTDSDNSELVLSYPTGEISLNLTYNALFGTTDAGVFEVLRQNSIPAPIYDFVIDSNQIVAEKLRQNLSLPYNGLFTEDHSQLSQAVIDTQLTAVDEQGNPVNLAQEQILISPGGLRFQIAVSDAGVISTVPL